MGIFLTSDTHFGHDKIIEYCKRPFSNSKEMDEVMVKNWNSVVTKEDEVYHLGDFGCGPIATAEYLEEIYLKLNGNIHFLKGNHDKSKRIAKIVQKTGVWPERIEIKVKGQRYVLDHWPQLTWNEATHGSYHCFGHVHGTMKGLGKSLDVGVDCWDFTPVNIEEVANKLATYQIVQTI